MSDKHQERRIIFIISANTAGETRKILSGTRIGSNGNFRHGISAFPSRSRVPLDSHRVIACNTSTWLLMAGATNMKLMRKQRRVTCTHGRLTEYHSNSFYDLIDACALNRARFTILLRIPGWSTFLCPFLISLRCRNFRKLRFQGEFAETHSEGLISWS